ncbi:hypothetical protein [Mastigocoleus testarum]|uniref:hypothetical protein n=1 Tax=Mastigocoleus testarum TaxID=996925 RepID=UPI00040D6F9E|nr:hypothetical protein [Mastigocoleus testarum]
MLQVNKNTIDALDIKLASWNINSLRAKAMGINFLQHPEENSMKISISHDGITGIYQDR